MERKPDRLLDGDLRKALVAFANTVMTGEVAILFIGAADDGRILGVQNLESLQKSITSNAAACYPPIAVRLRPARRLSCTLSSALAPTCSKLGNNGSKASYQALPLGAEGLPSGVCRRSTAHKGLAIEQG